MNVRTKLIIGFSVIVILLWLIAFFTITSYRNLNQQFLDVEEQILSETLFISNIESLANETYRGTLDYVLHGSEKTRLNTLSLLDLLARIEETNLSRNDDIDEKLFAAINQFHTAITNIIISKKNGATLEDLMVMEQVVGLPALLSLQQASTAKEIHNYDQLAVAKADFNSTYTTGLHTILISIALITLIALVAAILTTRSIVKPLNKLRKGTEIIAKGNLGYKVGTKASDEIGQLSRAFDRMTEGLKTTMTSVDDLNVEITERTKIEAALQRSEEKFRGLFENAKDAILLADAETGILIDVNQAGCDLLGLPKEKIIGMHQSQIHPTGMAVKYKDLFREHVEKGNSLSEDMLVQHADGTQVPVDISGSLVELDGRPTLQGIFRDITGRKQAEEALRINEERFRLIADNATDLISRVQITPEIRTDYVSPSCLRFTGYKQEDFYNDPNLGIEMIHPEDREFFVKHLNSGNKKDQKPITVRVVRKDGQVIWIEQTHTAIANDKGEIVAMHLIARDITERKHAEEFIRESEEKFSVAFRSSPHPMAISSLKDSRFIEVNDSFTHFTGYTHDEIIGHSAKDLNFWVNLDDRDRILNTLKNEGKVDSLEYLLRTKSGEIHTLLFSAEPITIFNEECMIAVTTDITERKKLQEALSQEAYWRRIMVEQSRDGIVILDQNGKVYEANRQFGEILGYSPEELLHLYVWDWDTQWTKDELLEMIRTVDENGDHFETYWKRKDGTNVNVEISTNGATFGEQKLVFCVCRDTTERKRMEERLRYHANLIENVSDAIISTDLEYKITSWNKAAELKYGWGKDEVIGKNIQDIIKPEYPDNNLEDIMEILKKDGIWRGEAIHESRDGKKLNILVSTSLIKDDAGNTKGAVAVFSDITERKQAEKDLRASQEFITSLLENAPTQIVVINPDTSIRYVNPKFEEVNGWTLDEIVGIKAPYPWWTDELKTEEAIEQFKEAIRMDVGQVESLARKKNGELYWLDLHWTAIKRDGKLQYCLVNSADINERKKMENELRVHRDHLEELVRERTVELTDLNRRLQHELKERKKAEVALLAAKEEAETANLAKSEFLARTSHEIRTPIHGVLGTINLVLDGKLEHEQRQYLNMAISSAEALLNIINDILDLSKIEAGQLEPEHESFDLRATLEDTLESMAVTAYDKGLELTCHLLGGVTTDLVGDPRHLRQILTNLIGNSIKFTEKGEVALYVEPIADSKKKTELHFTVRDTGIGIPKNKFDVIFEPFQQADGSINRKYGGTGLGLTISRHLINQMEGRIWVEKGPEKGSIFHFTGKFTKQTNDKHSANGSKNILNVQHLPLLLVDDNSSNRLMVKDTLVSWGFDVTDVDNGSTALKEIADAVARSIPYRIIVLDKTMEDMDGFAVAEQILSGSTMPSEIIMMLTPQSVSDDFSRCQKLGILNYVFKPIKESELQTALLTALGQVSDSKGNNKKTIRKHINVPNLRVLIAEDNATSQLVARKTLEKMGHHVEIAQNGSEAVKMTENGNFDLILMDAEMPVLDGLEATRLIRKREGALGKHIPIIAMTAYAMKEDKKKCLAAGMDGYLSKPTKPEEINAVVSELFVGKEKLSSVLEPLPEVQFENVPAVDIEAAMQVFDGDDELLREAVDLFLEEDYPGQLRLLREGIERQDGSAVGAAAHSIKGAARSLGGTALGEIALRLEKLGREGKLEGARELADKLENELKRFADYYSQSVESR